MYIYVLVRRWKAVVLHRRDNNNDQKKVVQQQCGFSLGCNTEVHEVVESMSFRVTHYTNTHTRAHKKKKKKRKKKKKSKQADEKHDLTIYFQTRTHPSEAVHVHSSLHITLVQ